ncbi:hypothetical protein A2533_03090 [Candidatus Falkowbacteria bacterium RIFOXYD2_FULL_35_9]|uniref:EF-hand domain-containing protein n=1 Tax=Candidatus Falkowbacteria bacterium RIFOXYC2_FULL_36_12 TaxID=1798002 RepID=A0A1F5SXD7_9BACT|nr:MAG: hypothetical protein A2478_00365 [Candidatus Falkowbacteria bacterium RIFOXYC2_FULL_36_12]OGF31558.1 MAG: hypothetical protein A2300_03705 [Candidatus Falkowbacteria bacterium RIFOXYB2_FULL_35_7]OGF33593.1 MAG: hypothetical protein A2223_03500 [Candidatus Falkowbacteria bacterium RIFOXYA2_FULL_35_8]OGF46958.1 MAG: hypothetical protein A2533_03090 [Candidatus Falkowbacteria bacterium RIFOXYD2_FULL_35_9]
MKKFTFFSVLMMLAIVFAPVANAASLAQTLSGKILLQVEEHGEAWYVYPGDFHRYYLGRPADAFDLMRNLGYGITNRDLQKIPVAASNMAGGIDHDGDGLKLEVEAAFGTSDLLADTDGDGYNDYEEIFFGYSPTDPRRVRLTNEAFARQHAGKIFLQVEAHGEAWYVDTIAYNRHYLGRPADAFEIMRSLGLGITNANLAQIPIANSSIPVEANWQSFSRTASGINYQFECPPDWSVNYATDYGENVTLTQCKKIYAGTQYIDDGIAVSVGYVPDSIAASYENMAGENYSYAMLQSILMQPYVSQYSSNVFSGAYSSSTVNPTLRFLARRTVGSGYIEIQATSYGTSHTVNQYLEIVNKIVASVTTN